MAGTTSEIDFSAVDASGFDAFYRAVEADVWRMSAGWRAQHVHGGSGCPARGPRPVAGVVCPQCLDSVGGTIIEMYLQRYGRAGARVR